MDLLEKYIHENSSPEDALLHELDRETHLRVINPRMISGHIQGKLLELIVKMFRPKSILEIGTFTADRVDDPDLADKLCGELEGIFLWAFAGLQRLAANHFRF
ncbi:MAG: hypothetical protein IIW87_01350, partial [Alistipes sp.]|nr:hypothetical protein [Alistipes sp.]